jgi:hypothetical protein
MLKASHIFIFLSISISAFAKEEPKQQAPSTLQFNYKMLDAL